MARTDDSTSPLEAAAGAAGPQVTELFGVLANETRLAILLALWEAFEPFADDTYDPSEGNEVSFSELRERVGMPDSGQFNYHLSELEGHFVQPTDDGYRLTNNGRHLIYTIVGGTGLQGTTPESAELSVSCNLCGAPTTLEYEHSMVLIVCSECGGYFGLDEGLPSGVLRGGEFRPAGLSDRTPDEVYAAFARDRFHRFAMRLERICPWCSGPVDATLHVCTQHDRPPDGVCATCDRRHQFAVRFVCTVCKDFATSTPGILAQFHPAVAAFYHDHGIDWGYGAPSVDDVRQLDDLIRDHDEELISADPLRVRVTVRYDGDTLELVLDEAIDILEVSGGN